MNDVLIHSFVFLILSFLSFVNIFSLNYLFLLNNHLISLFLPILLLWYFNFARLSHSYYQILFMCTLSMMTICFIRLYSAVFFFIFKAYATHFLHKSPIYCSQIYFHSYSTFLSLLLSPHLTSATHHLILSSSPQSQCCVEGAADAVDMVWMSECGVVWMWIREECENIKWVNERINESNEIG